MIDSLRILPLTQHCDDRGRVKEILRKDDPHFPGFGQAYFSSIYPGVIKAWHAHKKQTDCISVIHGMAKIGFLTIAPEVRPRAKPTASSSGNTTAFLSKFPRAYFTASKPSPPKRFY